MKVTVQLDAFVMEYFHWERSRYYHITGNDCTSQATLTTKGQSLKNLKKLLFEKGKRKKGSGTVASTFPIIQLPK